MNESPLGRAPRDRAVAAPDSDPATIEALLRALDRVSAQFRADLDQLGADPADPAGPVRPDPAMSRLPGGSPAPRHAVPDEGTRGRPGGPAPAVHGGRRRAQRAAGLAVFAGVLLLLIAALASTAGARRSHPADRAMLPTSPPTAIPAASAPAAPPAPTPQLGASTAPSATADRAAAPLPATPTLTAVPARRGVIVYAAYQADPRTSQLVAIEPDGTGRRILGRLPGQAWGPRLAPDGGAILFASAPPAAIGWPLDNDLNGTGAPDIWVAGVDGSGARQLTDAPASYNGWSWSPDGRWIAFASNRRGSWEIYKMTAAGTQLTRLTTTPAQDAWPVWTPDGAGIVFASTRSDRAQLYRMDADGNNVRRLLVSPTADTEPAVSPDGATITFTAQAADGTGEIYLAGRDGSAPRRLTALGGLNTGPAWSPDGRRLTFVRQHDGRSDLYAIDADGGDPTLLASGGVHHRPDWGTAAIGRVPGAPAAAGSRFQTSGPRSTVMPRPWRDGSPGGREQARIAPRRLAPNRRFVVRG